MIAYLVALARSALDRIDPGPVLHHREPEQVQFGASADEIVGMRQESALALIDEDVTGFALLLVKDETESGCSGIDSYIALRADDWPIVTQALSSHRKKCADAHR